MLPAIIVTLATFLLELCSTSPVYNMQPAFITNTIGATTGRNIRNLPCISRKNPSLHGVCMFAIDCVKSNGTHLGTCIDRFYFGSCCLIEPVVHEIVDNTIESDILPHREPPLRLTNTTSTTITTLKPVDETESSSSGTTLSLEKLTTSAPPTTEKSKTSSTVKLELFEQLTKAPALNDFKNPNNTTTVETSTTTLRPTPLYTTTRGPALSTEVTTVPQKLQTFQVVDGSTLEETTTKPSTTTIKSTKATTTAKPKTTIKSTQGRPNTTKAPVRLTSSKPTSKPTTRPKPVRISTTTSKLTNVPPKPTRAPLKPVRTTTKRPVQQTTKKPVQQTTKSRYTSKPTKRPTTITPKPTKRITSTTKTTIPSTTTTTTATTTTTVGTTSTLPPSTTTQKPEDVTVAEHLVLTTTVSNEIPLNRINISQILETVNGNPATNEIEAVNPIEPLVTSKPGSKPGLVTWSVVDEKNHTEPSSTEATNATTEDWVPITTPDGWVLLPSVEPNVTNLTTPETTASSSAQPILSNVSTSTSTLPPTTTTTTEVPPVTSSSPTSSSTEGRPSITYIPLTTTPGSSSSSVPNTTVTESSSPATDVPESTSESITAVTPRPINMSDFTDVCGRRMYPEARIVGGEKSLYGKWPWQISLRQWRTSTYLHKCGAALLNENWAITAAHCVDQVPPSELLLRLGEHDLSTEAEPYLHQERRVQIVASHPQFDPRTFEYDLALLRFYEPVTFQPNILPVCVPQTDENFVGRTAYVTGWGRLYENGPLPSVLQEVSVPVINNTVCESMYRSAGYIEHIPHIFICAGWRRGGFDSCEGDSGGPMVIQREDKRFLLAGVISWGIGCAEPNQPGVYTRISEFRDWINQILQF